MAVIGLVIIVSVLYLLFHFKLLPLSVFATAWAWLKTHWRDVVLVVLGVLVAFFGYREYQRIRYPAVQVMTPAQVSDPATVAQKLDVSQPVAAQIIREIQAVVQKEPAVTYNVTAATPTQAAQVVEKQIQTGTTPVTMPAADKTIVTPQQQKVDVYRITLDKPRGAGVYASSQSVGAMVQYKNVVVFGGPKYQGGYEAGAGYMIRW